MSIIWYGRKSTRWLILSWTKLDSGWMAVPLPDKRSLIGHGFCLCVFVRGLTSPACGGSLNLVVKFTMSLFITFCSNHLSAHVSIWLMVSWISLFTGMYWLTSESSFSIRLSSSVRLVIIVLLDLSANRQAAFFVKGSFWSFWMLFLSSSVRLSFIFRLAEGSRKSSVQLLMNASV